MRWDSGLNTGIIFSLAARLVCLDPVLIVSVMVRVNFAISDSPDVEAPLLDLTDVLSSR